MAARATSAFYHFTLILHLFLLINYNYGERYGGEASTLFINRAGDSSRIKRAVVINSEDNYVADSETSFLRKTREAVDHSTDSTAAQNASEPNIITKVNLLNDSHQQLMVHWVGERSDIIICLARDSTSVPRVTGYPINPSAVYISYDYGTTFENKTEYFKISDNPLRYATLDKFYNHPKYNTHCVFADNANKIIFITHDNGKNITAVNLTFHPSEITFYEDNPNYFVALDKIDPERPLRITHDMGKTWNEVEKYVKAFFWSSLHPKSIIIERASIDSHNVIESDLMIGQKFEKNLKRIISNVEDFQIKGDYMFATKKSITSDLNKNSTVQTLEFFVSYKNQPFVLAQFDTELERIAYHISDVSHNRIFVAVAHGETHINLYVSDVIDDKTARFKLSLERILTFFPNCTWKDTWLSEVADEAFTDLYKVEGLKGIYIASQLVALPAQVTVDPEHLVSVITYDHGATWNKIKAPLNVHEKKELINNGSAHEWSLHLSQRFSQLYPVTRSVSIMSSKSAPGIILATGVMGPNMKGHPGFYVSRDAGFTWKLVLKDYYFFNMGDHGGILIAVKYFKSRGETREITYSTDEGKTWQTHKFNQEVLRIYGLMTEPGENTTVFTMFGSNPLQHKWVIIKVDLQHAFERNCTADDFKFWSPSRPDEQCILGRQEVYQRRAANVNCYTGMDYDRPVTRESCPCDYQDYECDFGFIRSKSSQSPIHCIRDPLNTKYDPYLIPSDCPPGSFYNRTKGYRKIADDECSGGVARKFDPDEIPCPINEPSEFLLVAQREHISRIDLRSQNIETLPVRGLKNVIAIEYDLRNNCLYWADIVNDTIGRQCFRDGTSYPEILVETDLSSIEGMALDWVSNVLYFVDGVKMRIQIIRTDLTIAGRMRKTILGSNNLQKPRGIAVHPMRGYMFWTDWAPGNASVSRANLDGTNVKRLFTKGTVEWPNGITIDYNAGRIYWVDAREDYIAWSDFDGHGFRKVIQDDDRVSHPFAVAVFKNNIYWDDWKQSTIFAADKDHGMIVSMKAGILTGLMDLKVFAHSVQNGTNACANSTCSHLCIGTPENGHVCLCPDGMEMTNGKCLCPGGSQPYANSTCPQVASTCAHNQFACHNGVCIPEIWMCDGDNDCGDESDESSCKRTTCAPNNFECDEDKCIPRVWVCDLDRDCRDGKDEFNCTYRNCTESKFQCDNGRCITARFYCDGDDDCHDNSDERNCSKPSAPATCKSDELTCVSDHVCIPRNWQCDEERDCIDGTDEEGCNTTSCLDWQFSCNSTDPHQCIYGTWACDGERDCHDGSDEVNCSHPTAEPPLPPLLPSNSCIDWMFRCNNSRCVPYWWKCDNVDDCKDGSDEVGCGIIDGGITESPVTEQPKQPFVCQPHEFFCHKNSCIPNSWHCDGVSDCEKGEDEQNCPHTSPCTGDLFKCVTDGNCIPSSSICNGVEDCPDRSDEANCHKDLHPRPPGSPSCGAEYFPCDRCYHSTGNCDGKYYITQLDVNIRESNSTSLAVSWNVPPAPNATFEFLPSIAKLDNGSKWNNASNWIEHNFYQFTGLQPYTSYNATVYVKIKGQEIIFAPFQYWVISTGEGIPSKPWNVTAMQLDGTRIEVSWRPPQHPNGVILSYDLTMMALNFRENRNLVRTSFIFERPFEADRTYSFSVVAQNHEFKSEPSETVSVIFNGTANIDDIEDLRVIKTTNNTVELAWKALKNVDCYHISPRPPATYPAYPTSSTEKNEFTVPNLAPGVSFVFEVNAMTKPYVGNVVSIKATTEGVPLPIVPNFSAESRKTDGTTVKLSWDPPKNPKKLKWQYAIHYALNIPDLFKEFKLLTSNLTASIKDLHACESYIFAVGLRGDYGIGPLISPKTVFTYRNIRAPPKHLTVTQIGAVDKILVSWTASCIMKDDEPINYTISVVELVSNKTSTITLPPTNETALKHTFKDIKYGEKYKISVATDVEGAKSTEPVIYVAPPLPPPHQFGMMPAMGGFILFWEQDEMPHYLKNTTNYFYELLVNENLSEINETIAKVYKVPHTRFVFNETKANTVYSFAVRLATVDGYRSVLSEVESVLTHSAWPVAMNTSSLLSIAIPICLLIIALGAGMTYFFVRHRRLSNSFTQFANSHYDTRRGQATFPGTTDALDEEDSPVIRGFSDDEPLVIA